MKKYLLIFLAAALFSFAAQTARAKINVFACEPEWASLTSEIAGGKANIFTAVTAFQDPHTVAAKPSLIAQMRKADLLVCSGAKLETGWLPVLRQKAPQSPSGANAVMAADYVKRLEIPSKLDRAMGDVHAEGNPHVHLNPNNLLIISDVIVARLSALSPADKSYFEQRHKEFKTKMENRIKAWESLAAPLKGTSVISNHPSMTYLYDWLGIVSAGTLEPKPGVPPTSRHLSELADTAKKQNVRLIENVPFENAAAAKWLSEKTGVPRAELPFTVGGGGTKDLFGLFDKTIEILLSKEGK